MDLNICKERNFKEIYKVTKVKNTWDNLIKYIMACETKYVINYKHMITIFSLLFDHLKDPLQPLLCIAFLKEVGPGGIQECLECKTVTIALPKKNSLNITSMFLKR